MIACDWSDPGAHRYTGTAEAAIRAFAEIPRPVQEMLIEKQRKHEPDDLLIIDRDTIRGQRHEYAPDIRSMHFGSRGRVCDTVSRRGWKADHVETAMAFCAGGYCVAWPSVCGNFFLLTPKPQPEQPAYLPVPGVPALPDAPFAAGPDSPPLQLLEVPEQPEQFVAGFAPFFVPVAQPSHPGYLAPIAPVPEPPLWVLLVIGVILLGWRRVR